jgi:hypothetical protein
MSAKCIEPVRRDAMPACPCAFTGRLRWKGRWWDEPFLNPELKSFQGFDLHSLKIVEVNMRDGMPSLSSNRFSQPGQPGLRNVRRATREDIGGRRGVVEILVSEARRPCLETGFEPQETGRKPGFLFS